jgi:hypothetical protein
MTKNDILFRDIINKQLEPHGVTLDDVRHDPNWLHKYRFVDDAAYHEWKRWCIAEMRRRGYTEDAAVKQFIEFDSVHGLGLTKPYEDEDND